MIIQNELGIHSAVSRYLDGADTLQEFEDWFMPVLWDLGEAEDDDVRRLAGTIANLIAEYSGGQISESYLQRELASAIRPFESPAQGPPVQMPGFPLRR